MSMARILDANANRVREALRVMEDAARFVLNDAALAEQCKLLRHDFTSAMRDFADVQRARDTAGDVGTELTTQGEQQRDSIGDVVVAAGKRLGEALRSIEEYGKTVNADAAARVKQIRYRAYQLEQQLTLRFGPRHAPRWRLCLLLTAQLCPDGNWRRVAEAALDGGCDCIQLREKRLTDHQLLDRALALRNVTAGRAALIINDRADVAMLCGADGVHLGQDDLAVAHVRRLFGRQLLIGVSAHDMNEVDAAVRDGADYCGIGTMFPSPLKPARPAAGPAFLAAVFEKHPKLAHLAIGGITAANAHELAAVGCKGAAISTAICTADDPRAVATTIMEQLTGVAV